MLVRRGSWTMGDALGAPPLLSSLYSGILFVCTVGDIYIWNFTACWNRAKKLLGEYPSFTFAQTELICDSED